MKKRAVLVLAITVLLANTVIVAGASGAARTVGNPAQGADALLAIMPDADGVIAINVGQLNRQIQSFLASKPEAAADLQKQLDKMVEETGVDINSIDSIVAGISLGAGRGTSDPLILVSGSFNQQQVLSSIARKSGRKMSATKYNGQNIYTQTATAPTKRTRKNANTTRTSKSASLTFFDDHTLAIGSAAGLRQSIDTRAGTKASVMQNASLMTAFNQASASGSIRFALNVPEDLRRRLGEGSGQASFFKPLAAISQVLGSVDLNDASLLANLSLITGSDQEASEVVSFINNGLALVKLALGNSPEASPLLNMLNGITGSQAGNAANLTVNVPTDLLRGLFDQIKSKAPKG